jgi:tellurite methyltransferase
VEPLDIVVRAASLLPPGRALDLACGRGRNALYLASIGWHVTAIDIDPHVTPEPSPSLDVRVMDLEKDPLSFDDASFDLIVITHYFQPALFPVVRRLLRVGGVLVTSAKMSGRFAIQAGALAAAFADWRVVHRFENGIISELIAEKAHHRDTEIHRDH